MINFFIWYFGIGFFLWLFAITFGKKTRELLCRNFETKDPAFIAGTIVGQIIFIAIWPFVLGTVLYLNISAKIRERVLMRRIKELEKIIGDKKLY